MRAVGLAVATAFAVGTALAPAVAPAAIVVTPGANTVSTPRLELDFGDSASKVEQLDVVRWRDSTGLLGPNLTANSDAACDPGGRSDTWGEAGSQTGDTPQPAGSGSTGTWTPRGGRSIEILSTRPTDCTGDTTVTPVRTRYTFFNVGDGASRARVERTFSFSAATPDYATATMRAYVAHLPQGTYTQVIHPNAGGSELVVEVASPAGVSASWNQTWLALNDPVTERGVLILRETANPAQIWRANNGNSNYSAVDLLKPIAGWKAPITETEWLCFYDLTSWPTMLRAPDVLPSQCAVVPVPINSAAPAISGEAKVGTTLTASSGAWDGAASLVLQWLRCAGGACAAIPGATDASYTPSLADEGRQLRVDVTATAPGGEADTASSPLTAAVATGPPQNTALPAVSGEARVKETLTGTTGAWSSSPTSFLYQWLRCANAAGTSCADVAGATKSTYKLTSGDLGATMRLRVRTINGLGTSLPAESAPTGEVLREVIRARLSLAPSPSCTGALTTFDGSRSTSPNGAITYYRYRYKIIPTPVLSAIILSAAFGGGDARPGIDRYLATVPSRLLKHGANAATVKPQFTWNRRLTQAETISGGKAGDFARDPIYVTLTVSDATGASDTSAPILLTFAQFYSSQPRTRCPRTRPVNPFAFATVHTAVFASAKAVSARIPCATRIECAGSLTLVLTGGTVGRAAKAKPVVLARNPLFTVPGRGTRSVRATLTRAGQLLARRGRPVRARLRITSINALTGRRTTRSVAVTLPGRKSRR